MDKSLKLKCPACGIASPVKKWAKVDVDCELCGPAEGVQCPRFFCRAEFSDCTFDYPEEVKE